jgi:hypothetical protein
MQAAFNLSVPKDFKKRVFLLTDGEVGGVAQIVDLVRGRCKTKDDVKVFSFGMG